MAEKHISKKELENLSKLVEEIDNNNSFNVIDILREFSSQNWRDWLEDIMNYGIAFPVSQITSDGDILTDVIDFLRTHNISVYHYETGVSNFVNQLSISNTNPTFLERLINILIIIKGQKAEFTLTKILTSRDNNFLIGKYDYIKSLALLALARSSALNESTKLKAHNYLIIIGLKEMKHDPSFYANALRLSYLQFSLKSFFKDLEIIIEILNPDRTENHEYATQLDRYVIVLVDILEEVHYRDIATFYSTFCNWYIDCITSKGQYSLIGNKLFEQTSIQITNLINSKTFVKEIFNLYPPPINTNSLKRERFSEYEYAKCLQFILNVTHERLDSNLTIDDILDASAFLIETINEKSIDLLFEKLSIHRIYIGNICGILPYVAKSKLSNSYNELVIQKVIDLFDKILYTKDDDEGEQDEDLLKSEAKKFFLNFGTNEKSAAEAINKQYAGTI